jgi:hypothetical protein
LGEVELAIGPFAKNKFENESLAHPAKAVGEFERDNVLLTLQTLRLPSRKVCTTNLPDSLLTSPTQERN